MTRIPAPLPQLLGTNFLRAIYRMFDPIPTSPVPGNEIESHALVLVPPLQLTRKFVSTLKYLQKQSKCPIGDYVEFGVYNGTSMGCMFDALKQLRLHQVRLFGFDSFKGLPPDIAEDDGGVWKPGQFECPKEIAIENLAAKGVPPSRVCLIEGWYKDTLNPAVSCLEEKSVSVVMLDCDAYSSSKIALNFIHPFLKDISALFFDDWRLNDLDLKGMGEFRAFNEFLRSHSEFRVSGFGRYNRKSKVFIVRRENAGSLRDS